MDKQLTKAGDNPDVAGYKDLSLPELSDMLPDDQAARVAGRQHAAGWSQVLLVWVQIHLCPKTSDIQYYCSECDKRFSIKICTVMEHSRIGYQR